MSKILVVVYSRSGNTLTVGKAIASALDADLEQLTDIRPRDGFIQYLKSGHEALTGKKALIMPTNHDPDLYDLVVLGTPIWVSHIASPMRTFVAGNLHKLSKWGVFCTEGGTGHDKVFLELTEMIGTNPAARLHVTENEVRHNKYMHKVDEFVSTVGYQSDTEA